MEDDIVWMAEEMAFQKYTESRDTDIVKGKVFYCSLQKKKKKRSCLQYASPESWTKNNSNT